MLRVPHKPAVKHNPGLLDCAKILQPLEEELALRGVFCVDRFAVNVDRTVKQCWFHS